MKTALQVYVDQKIEAERATLRREAELKDRTTVATMLQEGLPMESIARYLSLPLATIQALTSHEAS